MSGCWIIRKYQVEAANFILSSEIEQKHWMLLNYKHGAEKTLLNHLFLACAMENM